MKNGEPCKTASHLRQRRGLTLVEAIVSLAISAMLLVALAAAFRASAHTVASNDSYFRCTQTARLALDQITGELRRADGVQIEDDGTRVRFIRPADQLTPREIERQYAYDPDRHCITLQIFYDQGKPGPCHELAGNVARCKFAGPDATAHGGCICISLTCSDGMTSVTLDGSVTPRREQ